MFHYQQFTPETFIPSQVIYAAHLDDVKYKQTCERSAIKIGEREDIIVFHLKNSRERKQIFYEIYTYVM